MEANLIGFQNTLNHESVVGKMLHLKFATSKCRSIAAIPPMTGMNNQIVKEQMREPFACVRQSVFRSV